MADVIGIYGFGITRPLQVAAVSIEPCFTTHGKAHNRARDSRQFFLTAVGQLEPGADDKSTFDLAAAMTFCEQRWVIVTGPFRMASGATLDHFKRELPAKLDMPSHREGGGPFIMEDTFVPDSRQKFLDLCLRRLRDKSFTVSTGFREAFFRSVQVWRLCPAYLDLTYYLDFSAVEILARTSERDYHSLFAPVAARYLKSLGFDVVQNDPSCRVRSMQTYAHLRNALFHQGKFEARFRENARDLVLSLTDYEGYWRRLVPDVLLKALGFDDGHINWNRWIDQMPFIAGQKEKKEKAT